MLLPGVDRGAVQEAAAAGGAVEAGSIGSSSSSRWRRRGTAAAAAEGSTRACSSRRAARQTACEGWTRRAAAAAPGGRRRPEVKDALAKSSVTAVSATALVHSLDRLGAFGGPGGMWPILGALGGRCARWSATRGVPHCPGSVMVPQDSCMCIHAAPVAAAWSRAVHQRVLADTFPSLRGVSCSCSSATDKGAGGRRRGGIGGAGAPRVLAPRVPQRSPRGPRVLALLLVGLRRPGFSPCCWCTSAPGACCCRAHAKPTVRWLPSVRTAATSRTHNDSDCLAAGRNRRQSAGMYRPTTSALKRLVLMATV